MGASFFGAFDVGDMGVTLDKPRGGCVGACVDKKGWSGAAQGDRGRSSVDTVGDGGEGY